MNPAIQDVFEVVTRRFAEDGVDFLMIGGHAVNYYGFIRATMDVNFMIAASAESTVRQMMKEAGFTNISRAENVILFARPDSSLRVDLLHNGSPKRAIRDSEDVVCLVIEHQWDLEKQLKPLCERFADASAYDALKERIHGERDD